MGYADEIKAAPDVIRDYLNYIRVVRAKSNLTVDEYFIDLRTFYRFIKLSRGLADIKTDGTVELEDISIDDVNLELVKSITLNDVYEFMNYMISERSNHSATLARKASALRGFYKYLHKKVNLIDENPLDELDTPKTKKGLPKYLTLDESIKLLQSVDGNNRERDYCILTLFLNCGMRLSELCGINISDIRDDGTLRLLGKGNKERVIYLNHACKAAINVYMRVRPADGVKNKNALFLSRLKKRISNKTVQYIVKKYIERAGLGNRGLSTHKLRHTAATLMYQYGDVDIRVLKDVLGHENLGTTEIYTHLSSKQIEEAANANPLSGIEPKKVKNNDDNIEPEKVKNKDDNEE